MFSNTSVQQFRRRLLSWFTKHGRDLPWRRTGDPYAILVSEVMLQQTQVGTVRNYYEKWMARFPNIATLAAAPESEVLHAWQGMGYYARGRNLHAAAKRIVAEHGGSVPSAADVLRTLPGMGRYTANAVATFAFDQSVPLVEANISRVVARLFNIHEPIDSTTGRDQLWKKTEMLVPHTNAGRFNSALMDLGALVCVRQKPKCVQCPVKPFCRAKQPELLPIKKPRPKTRRLTEFHTFTVKRGRILLEQCPQRWRGMWMLPVLSPSERTSNRAIHSSVFPFTHHQITLRVFRGSTAPGRVDRQRWIGVGELEAIPIPSPHRRAISACLSLDVER